MRVTLIAVILAAFLFTNSAAAADKVVCYYGSWAAYRTGNGKFDVENIDPKLCTHLIYSFIGLNTDGTIKVLDPWNDLDDNGGRGGFRRFVNLKKIAPGVKTLVAIGGGSDGGAKFSQVTRNANLRATFVQNAVQFVRKYKFDGLDLDWEFPANPDVGGRPEDVTNFSILIRELRSAFDPLGLLLTAAVAATESAITKYYQIPQLSQYLHFINVMAYDLHGTWESVTGINAPLNARTGDNPQLNVKACIEAWIRHGADPRKLILGMGTYGRSFTLANANNHGVGAPTTGPGNAGKYSKEAGTLGYNEIVEMLRDGQLVEAWENQQQVPYAYKGNQWVGYDNVRSIKLKCDYAKQMGLGGGMVWKIDTDDFLGVSGTRFALIRTINSNFGRIV